MQGLRINVVLPRLLTHVFIPCTYVYLRFVTRDTTFVSLLTEKWNSVE